MRMDAAGAVEYRGRYETMGQLREYMYGSAVVIGLQMLPVLGTVDAIQEAVPAAGALGEAFQLTNFIRDVGEDLNRGRVYLPLREWEAFGVDEGLLKYCRATGQVDARVRQALAHFTAVTRAVYREAEAGPRLLSPTARPGIAAALVVYRAILDEVEGAGFAVFDRRAKVPAGRRLALAVGAALLSSSIHGVATSG
jgi:phytoene synthase